MQGFKIDFLLKLHDVKATDRKTSLLQFCIEQAMDKSPTLQTMAAELSHVKPAARLQITAVSTMMAELQTGLNQCKEATLIASQGDDDHDGRPSVRIGELSFAFTIRTGCVHIAPGAATPAISQTRSLLPELCSCSIPAV